MTGKIIEFIDGEVDYEDDSDYVVLPRAYYLEFIELIRKARVYDVFQNSTQFICDTCKSFILPAQALYWLLGKMDQEHELYLEHDIVYELRSIVTKTFKMSYEECSQYDDGKLSRVPFLYEPNGEYVEGEDGYPLILACDELVFRFRRQCACGGIIRNLYEN